MTMEDFDSYDQLPNLDHWKAVMEFSVEQAALLMAGFDPLETNLETVKTQRLSRWKQAHGYALGIVSAIRQGLISPVACRGLVWVEGWNNSVDQVMTTVRATDREAEISTAETLITRASLVGWINSERVQIARPPKPVTVATVPAEASRPVTVEAKPEPLALPYHGHKSEGLEFVDDAIKQMWATYDHDDPRTSPTQEEVIKYLRGRGAGANMAEAVNLILRPANLRRGGRKNKKVPT